jgi:predicted TIM-barrel fold metal-dependent hydrolase
MMLDAPLAPTLDIEADDRPGKPAESRLAIIDGDVHPAPRSVNDIKAFLPQRWREHLEVYGSRRKLGMSYEPYPKSTPRACRRDAWPETGGNPGSDLDLIRSQYLDAYGIEYGILGPLGLSGHSELNQEFSAALATAANEWQLEHFTRPEPRLRAAIVAAAEHAEAAVAEIERCADNPAYAQVFMLTRTGEPLGNRRYWPIYAAAERHGLPIGLHVFGSGGHAYTGTGWPSYYVEEGAGHSTSCQTAVTSLVIEGVFERFPRLKVVMIEGGFGWLPALSWRLDKLFERMRSEVPHLKMKPSEYIRRNLWLTTQPMEEPQDRRQLFDIMEWIGWDRLLFASDYPHWDFDDPFRAFPAGLPKERHKQILAGNGRAVYRLG